MQTSIKVLTKANKPAINAVVSINNESHSRSQAVGKTNKHGLVTFEPIHHGLYDIAVAFNNETYSFTGNNLYNPSVLILRLDTNQARWS